MDDTNTYNISTHTISQHTISQHTISQHIQYLNTYNLSTHTISQHTISQTYTIVYTSAVNFHLQSILTAGRSPPPLVYRTQFPAVGGRNPHIQYLNTYNLSNHNLSTYNISTHTISQTYTIVYTSAVNFHLQSILTAGRSPPPLVYRTQFPAVGGRNPHIQSINIDTSAVDSYLRARASILTSGRSPALVYRAELAPLGGAPPRCGALPPPPRKQPSKISRPFDITHKE